MATKPVPFTTKLRLYLAGWRPHRDVWGQLLLPVAPPIFPEAERILRNYGGLRFGDSNEHVRLDPIATVEDDEGLVQRCEAAVGRRLYPIGYQEHQDREAIFVDEAGAVYINFGDELHLLGSPFEAVLGYLVHTDQARDVRRPKRASERGATSWFAGDAATS